MRFATFLPALAMWSTAAVAAGEQQQPQPSKPVDQTQDIIVTATKRTSTVQKVPISITALDEKALGDRGAVHIEDYARLAPGLVYASNGANGGTFSIRGINTTTLAGNTQSPVAIYYDDMPALNSFIPVVTPDLRLFDVARVEVLRGPQGTLFGSGALGGAIRIITNKPTPDAFAWKTELTLSDTHDGGTSNSENAMVNVPLGRQAALRVVGYREDIAGWVDNPVLGRKDVNRQRNWGGRIMLGYSPTARLDLLASISHQDDHPRDAEYSLYVGPARTYNGRAAQFSRQRLTTYNLTGNYDFGGVRLTSVSTYADQQQAVTRDFSAVVASLGLPDPGPYNATGPSKSFAQELRLASSGSGALSWLVGAFYLRNNRTLVEELNVPGAGAIFGPLGFPSDDLFLGVSHIRTREKALFGEISYKLTDELTATAGARLFWNTIHVRNRGDGLFAGGTIINDRLSRDHAVTPKFALQWQFAPTKMFYLQAAQGYRVGQLNLGPANDPVTGMSVPISYGPDSLWNYEAGLKTQFWNRRLTFNVAAYHIDWKDIQLQDSTPSGFAFINNAGRARSQGVEGEARLDLTPALHAGGAISLNHTRLTRKNPGVRADVGDELPGAPKLTLSEYAEYRSPIGRGWQFFARVDHQYRGRAFATLQNSTSPKFGGFNVINLRAGIDAGRWELTGFVNNVADSNGKQNVVILPGGPAAVRLRPRTFGVTLRAGY